MTRPRASTAPRVLQDQEDGEEEGHARGPEAPAQARPGPAREAQTR
jgi:hypothetical protein